MIEKEDIKKLAKLSRISVRDEELDSLTSNLEEILQFISQLNEVTQIDGSIEPYLECRNVLRDDSESQIIPGGKYSEDILKLAPKSDGKYIHVDKIIKE